MKLKNWKKELINLKYETNKYIYEFQQFQMIKHFRDCIFTGKITINEADKKQCDLKVETPML